MTKKIHQKLTEALSAAVNKNEEEDEIDFSKKEPMRNSNLGTNN